MLTIDGIAKIGDFGLTIKSFYPRTHLGTPHWMAPELIEFLPYNTSADVNFKLNFVFLNLFFNLILN